MMSKTLKKQGGFILTAELLLLSLILVIGLIVGLVTMRDAITAEMEDTAEAIGQLDQTYFFEGMINAQDTATVAGSAFGDAIDANAGDQAAFEFTAVLVNGEGTVLPPSNAADSAVAPGGVLNPETP